jgi:hypothetical protein
MDFYFKYNRIRNSDIELRTTKNQNDFQGENTIYLFNIADSLTEIKFSGGMAIFIGDPLFPENKPDSILYHLENNRIGDILKEVNGFFYLIVLHEAEKRLIISASMFSILPVFFKETGDSLILSSSFEIIAGNAGGFGQNTDKVYYIEKSVFNFPFLNRTPIKEISTIPSNSFIEIAAGAFVIQKHTVISDYFSMNPKPWKTSLNELAILFIERARMYFPQEKFIATLTGGFDSRTVVSLALNDNRDFETFSYGSRSDPDVLIPEKISSFIQKEYKPVILDETYASEYFWDNACRFLLKSYGGGNFSRAHYYYALTTRLLNSNYLLSGNFGSEIIRSMKMPGVMTSSVLFSMFEGDDMDELRDHILKYRGTSYLNTDLVSENIEELITEIEAYKKSLPAGLTVNQKFYTYLFEEVFRKYFGPEIMVQRQFLKHRAPFLNFSFIEAALQTEIAGANSNFREENPLKRYHGQVLYSNILKRTFPALLKLPLDRGYCPEDFLSVSGHIKIAANYLKRNYLIRRDKNLPSYSTLTYEPNLFHFNEIPLDKDIFDTRFFRMQLNGGWATDQMHFINMISSAYYQHFLIK